jgi:hypothetical protein
MVFKTYKGSRLDLQHYKGKDIINYEFEILNDDGTAYDLSIYDDIIIKFFEKRHGTLLEFWDLTDGINLASPVDNFIDWTANIDYRPKFYYHECYGTIGTQEELLFHGVSEVI